VSSLENPYSNAFKLWYHLVKPQHLKYPFTWEERRPLFTEGVLFVPKHYEKHKEGEFPGLNDSRIFVRSAPIDIEYCSGNGAWIIDKAKQHPERNWIAVEKRFERVRKIWSKMRNLRLDNLLIVCGEASDFTRYYLNDHSIANVYVNFPDPWPKGKHVKHRLFQESFVKEIARITQAGSSATIVTDDPLWAERIGLAMRSQELWNPVFPAPFYITEWPNYGTSYFDELWRQKGCTIHYLQFTNQKIC
jgi:tRNA (guanine-N7-)-methyltransferase